MGTLAGRPWPTFTTMAGSVRDVLVEAFGCHLLLTLARQNLTRLTRDSNSPCRRGPQQDVLLVFAGRRALARPAHHARADRAQR